MLANIQPLSHDVVPTNAGLINPAATHAKIYQYVLIITDLLMLVAAFSLAYWLRFQGGITLSPEVLPYAQRYVTLVAILVPSWLFLFALMRLYDVRQLLGGTREYSKAFNACTSGMMLVILYGFVDENIIISRGWLVMSWLLAGFFVCSGRLTLRRVAYTLRRQGYFVARSLIIGTNEEARTLASQLKDSSYSGLQLQGFIETGNGIGHGMYSGLPVLGGLNSLNEIIQQKQVTEVIVSSTALDRNQLLSILRELSATPEVELRLSSGLYEAITTTMHVTIKGAVPFMSPDRWRLDLVQLSMKRLLDLIVIAFALPALLPIFAAIALLIKLDSPGPIFFRRRVLGVGGQQFDAFKFRTMAVNGDEILAQNPELQAQLMSDHKLKDDPRITRIGNLLRMTSLDELPQLINIMLGQMSLVGPRMISPVEAEMYGIYSADLLTVKPGLTGLWQVSGRSDLTYSERVRLDMYYIRNYSIWLDLQILFLQTLPAVIKGRGAY